MMKIKIGYGTGIFEIYLGKKACKLIAMGNFQIQRLLGYFNITTSWAAEQYGASSLQKKEGNL